MAICHSSEVRKRVLSIDVFDVIDAAKNCDTPFNQRQARGYPLLAHYSRF